MFDFRLDTGKKEELIDITSRVECAVSKSNVKNGVCIAFVPHTTAGILINEGADPDVAKDILSGLARIVPGNESYAHGEGNSPAHIKSCLTGSSVAVFVKGGKLALGRWQSIFLAEFDGPRERKVQVSVVKSEEPV